jgi:H+-transporting ATPase
MTGAWRSLGLLPLFDPPRDDSAETIDTGSRMGLDVRMVTGDHVAIARETARRLLLSPNIAVAGDAFVESGADMATTIIQSAKGFAQVSPRGNHLALAVGNVLRLSCGHFDCPPTGNRSF